MTDLVLLRELIKNGSALGRKEELSRVFNRCDLDCLFESIVVRASMPYSPVAISLCSNFLSVKTIQSRARAGGSIANFQTWYTERLNVTLPIDVSPTRYKACNNAMNRVRAPAVRYLNKLRIPQEDEVVAHVTRPSPLVLRERLARVENATYADVRKRKSKTSDMSAKSPRAAYAFHSTEPSLSSDAESRDFHWDSSQSQEAMSQNTTPHTADASDDGSVVARERSPTKLGPRNTFDETLKAEVLDIVNEFTESPSLLQSAISITLTGGNFALSHRRCDFKIEIDFNNKVDSETHQRAPELLYRITSRDQRRPNGRTLGHTVTRLP